MRLETARLVIRSLTLADEHAFIEMASDGSLHEIFGDCSRCHEWMGDWLREAMQLEAEGDPYRAYLAFAIERRADGRTIGSVGTSYYEDMDKVGITYFLGAQYRGQGYMAEAVRAFVRHVFAEYGVDALFATAAQRNVASCRTLERAGFELTDTRPYRDMFDEVAELSNFYELRRGALSSRMRNG